MSDNRRILRVAREIKEILSSHFLSGLKVPIPGFVSIVDVDVSPDLRSAKVFLRVAGSTQERAEAEKVLQSQRAEVQRELGRGLNAKFCPALKFVIGGPSEAQMDDVERMLANLHRPRRGED